MTAFAKDAIFLFLALRAGDVINLAAGMWLVPKFIAPEDLGAVLPVTTVATLLSLPIFAFGMAVMKESADLALQGERGKLKTLLQGVFITIATLTVCSLIIAAFAMPRYLARSRISSPSTAIPLLVFAAALLGSVAPVYTDALQSLKRFRSLGAIECLAAAIRFVTLIALMPVKAFAGYFAGNAMQPLVRICASVMALRREFAVPSERWWTLENTKRLCLRFALVLLYIVPPMLVAGFEQDFIRHELPTVDSAAYFIVTRLSDIMNYLSFPLLLVIFPYSAEANAEGRTSLQLVAQCSAITLAAATLLGVVYSLWGGQIIALIPNGANYREYLPHLPMLLAITALTACQTFFTNAEIAAGRFKFLWWFVPMNIVYLFVLIVMNGRHLTGQDTTLSNLLTWFLVGAILRFACATAHLTWQEIPAGRSRT